MKKFLLAVFAIFFTTAWTFPVVAFDRGACREDVEKYCKGVPVGDGRIKKCLMKNIDKVSDGCKANMVDAAVKRKEAEAK